MNAATETATATPVCVTIRVSYHLGFGTNQTPVVCHTIHAATVVEAVEAVGKAYPLHMHRSFAAGTMRKGKFVDEGDFAVRVGQHNGGCITAKTRITKAPGMGSVSLKTTFSFADGATDQRWAEIVEAFAAYGYNERNSRYEGYIRNAIPVTVDRAPSAIIWSLGPCTGGKVTSEDKDAQARVKALLDEQAVWLQAKRDKAEADSDGPVCISVAPTATEQRDVAYQPWSREAGITRC
jgi:hypothetical protein